MPNHKQLTKRAAKWLRGLGCSVVIEEMTAYTPSGETPDAIGWTRNMSILVECKTTRADFRADGKKRARQEGRPGLGHWRFYLTPPGLLSKSDLPTGWGLYEVHGRQVRYMAGVRYSNAGNPEFSSDRSSEVALLASALRRIKMSTCVYVVSEPERDK